MVLKQLLKYFIFMSLTRNNLNCFSQVQEKQHITGSLKYSGDGQKRRREKVRLVRIAMEEHQIKI